ncbi:hypothetical protein PMAYCL1PPCAC_28659, partial [Pristionchus mayeri]
GRECACTTSNFSKKNWRMFFDEKGTCRTESGLTFAGVDGVPTKLTSMELANPMIVSCEKGCGCGKECKQRVTRGCRYVQILHIDPDCGLDMRAGELIPRGEIVAVMAGTWVHRKEENVHDERMFFSNGANSPFTLTNDDKKNNFFTYNHSCRPNLVSTSCIVERNKMFPRPILLTRCAIEPGTRMTWHYNPGKAVSFPCRCGSGKDCCNPAL